MDLKLTHLIIITKMTTCLSSLTPASVIPHQLYYIDTIASVNQVKMKKKKKLSFKESIDETKFLFDIVILNFIDSLLIHSYNASFFLILKGKIPS